MTASPATGWQMVLADLSLILFTIALAAMGEPRIGPRVAPLGEAPGTPVAVWHADHDNGAAIGWLNAQSIGEHGRINIHGNMSDSELNTIQRLSARIADDPALAAVPRRLILDTATQGGVFISVSYDR